MSRTQAFQLFRQCSSSFSSRHVARTSVNAVSRRLAGARCYSVDAAKGAETTSQAGKKTENGDVERVEETEKDEVTISPEHELVAEVKKKDAEIVDLKSRLRYLQADFLNLQRNAAREKEQTRDFAITKFAGDLLETVDVLALALKSVPQSALKPPSSSPTPAADPPASSEKPAEAHLQELYTGVEMTHRLLLQTLFKYHVKPFDPTGDKFDPNLHEALYQAPVPGKEPGTVLECQKIGYKIKDRVLRAAQVGVVQDTS